MGATCYDLAVAVIGLFCNFAGIKKGHLLLVAL